MNFHVSQSRSIPVLSTNSLSTNRIHGIGVSVQDGNVSLYIDGKYESSSTGHSIDYKNLKTTVGSRSDNSQYFDGKIGCIQIWDKSLKSNEFNNINASYSFGTCKDSTAPLNLVTLPLNSTQKESKSYNPTVDSQGNNSVDSLWLNL